jgi:hypothetical protein
VKDKRSKGGKTEEPDEYEYAEKSANPDELQFLSTEEVNPIKDLSLSDLLPQETHLNS